MNTSPRPSTSNQHAAQVWLCLFAVLLCGYVVLDMVNGRGLTALIFLGVVLLAGARIMNISIVDAATSLITSVKAGFLFITSHTRDKG